jgi:hypothetical protein
VRSSQFTDSRYPIPGNSHSVSRIGMSQPHAQAPLLSPLGFGPLMAGVGLGDERPAVYLKQRAKDKPDRWTCL